MNIQIIETLESHQIKPTPMRMLVLEQFYLRPLNLTLKELEELLYPADRITIYRSLQTFVKQGILHTIETASNGSVYALCADNCGPHSHSDNHPHFICTTCGQTFCTDDFSYHIKTTAQSKKYHIEKIEVTLKGVCSACNEPDSHKGFP